tara:strand:+ start:1266 stop:1616 length:351 start_codon:yes stop_codon:yes gene_type:complete
MSDKFVKMFIFGLISVQIIIKILKRIIRQKRPIQKKYSDFGMPSTRAGFVFFIASYLLLSITDLSFETKMLIIVFAFCSCLMKVFLKEHTSLQIIVGGFIGLILGYTFYNLTFIQL